MRAIPCAAVLCIALASVVTGVLGGCGGSPGSSNLTASERGAQLYATRACATCHGVEGAGGPLAPSLAGLAEHWDRAGIADYLSDPRVYLEKDPRLKELERQFSAQMPNVTLPEEDRLAVADHVLWLSSQL